MEDMDRLNIIVATIGVGSFALLAAILWTLQEIRDILKKRP